MYGETKVFSKNRFNYNALSVPQCMCGNPIRYYMTLLMLPYPAYSITRKYCLIPQGTYTLVLRDNQDMLTLKNRSCFNVTRHKNYFIYFYKIYKSICEQVLVSTFPIGLTVEQHIESKRLFPTSLWKNSKSKIILGFFQLGQR